jgi:glutamate-1-semialdehyde 2,1-aminomutase
VTPAREWRTKNGNQNSERVYVEACEYIPGGVNSSLRSIEPHLVFTRAAGAIIVDADGNEYIDYQAGFGPPILGHSHPAVTRRVKEVIEELDLVGTGTAVLEVELAKKIAHHVPSAEKVLFCNSGSEATYMAIRLARAVTGRKKIIKFQGCYHGWHDSVAMNVISPIERIGSKDPLSAGSLPEVIEQTVICAFNSLDDVEKAVKENQGDIAAIILEPIPHNIGCVLPRPGFLEGLREITSMHGSVLIFDEVITGFRHNLGGYQAICDVMPDITTLGKSIANGYPLAAVGARSDLMDQFNTNPSGNVLFAGTFNGHPLNCAAALATIEVLESPGAYEHLFRLGERVRNGLTEIMERNKVEACVAGFGSVFLTYFMAGPIDSYTDLLRNDSQFQLEYRRRLIDKGIFKLPMNLKRSHISLSHTEADIDRTLQACEDTIKEMKKSLG